MKKIYGIIAAFATASLGMAYCDGNVEEELEVQAVNDQNNIKTEDAEFQIQPAIDMFQKLTKEKLVKEEFEIYKLYQKNKGIYNEKALKINKKIQKKLQSKKISEKYKERNISKRLDNLVAPYEAAYKAANAIADTLLTQNDIAVPVLKNTAAPKSPADLLKRLNKLSELISKKDTAKQDEKIIKSAEDLKKAAAYKTEIRKEVQIEKVPDITEEKAS